MKLTNAMAWLAAALVVLGAGGCKSDQHAANDPQKASDEFKQDLQPDRVTRFADVQAANGARHDAMLYPVHFSGGHLNSLGRSKVLLMLDDCADCEPATVHLVNCGSGDLLAQRKSAVEAYLKTTQGPNTLTFHPAAPELLRFNKTESGSAEADKSPAPQDSDSLGALNKDSMGTK